MVKLQKINDILFRNCSLLYPTQYYMLIKDGAKLRLIDSHACPSQFSTERFPKSVFSENLDDHTTEEWVAKIEEMISIGLLSLQSTASHGN